IFFFFFFQAEDGIRDRNVTGVQTCALPILDITVTLQDSTAGVPVGTQTIHGLGAGATTTLVFSWNTTGAALGGHTLVATDGLARSEERRVGKECRSEGSRGEQKENRKEEAT